MIRYAAFLALAPLIAHADEAMVQDATAFIETTLSAFEQGDHAALMAARPPAQLRVLAEAAATTEQALLVAHAQMVANSLEIIALEHARILPGTATLRTTPTGKPYVEAIIEEYWRIDVDNMHRVTSPVIAFQDQEQWGLTNVTKARDTLSLRSAYPDFLNVAFPAQKMERVWDNVLPADLKKPE